MSKYYQVMFKSGRMIGGTYDYVDIENNLIRLFTLSENNGSELLAFINSDTTEFINLDADGRIPEVVER